MNDFFKLKDFGPVKDAEVEFGDITFLVGPQASGKSIFLQAWKLSKDYSIVKNTLDRYLYVTDQKEDLIKLYFGISKLNPDAITLDAEKNSSQPIFYIPAQRVMSISDGRPKNFMEFDYETPFVIREFSEYLRQNFGPYAEEMAENIQNPESIYHGAKIEIDSSMGQKKMRLHTGENSIAFMSWSAGQKEYMPFNMASYFIRKSTPLYKYIVIEEPEMGLHPRAILEFAKDVFGLVNQGYKIVISTHSPVFLEIAWGISEMRKSPEQNFKKAMLDALDINAAPISDTLFGIRNNVRTYFFDNGVSRDISTLDVMNDDKAISELGELTSFVSRMCDAVSANKEEE